MSRHDDTEDDAMTAVWGGLGEEVSFGLGDEVSLPFPDLNALEARIGHTFNNRELLERALTHPSYSNERRRKRKHNQRLEFLGDAVLGLVTATCLYAREEFEDEGMLTRSLSALVCEEALARKARELDLGLFLKLGKGEDSQGGRDRDSILCDAYEALLAAVFIDGGYEAGRAMVMRLHARELAHIERPRANVPNYKGQLQSVVQARYNTQPTYHILQEQGPEHSKLFVAEVRIMGEAMGQGTGRSKKAAEQAAAEQAFLMLAPDEHARS